MKSIFTVDDYFSVLVTRHSGQFRAHGFSCDTKAAERKHQQLKHHVEGSMKNLQGWEFSLLSRMVFCDISEQRKLGESAWKFRFVPAAGNTPSHVSSSWITFFPGQPLLWWRGGDPECCLLLKVDWCHAEIVLELQEFDFARSLQTGIYEWKHSSGRRVLRLDANACGARPAHYWRRRDQTLLTVW